VCSHGSFALAELLVRTCNGKNYTRAT